MARSQQNIYSSIVTNYVNVAAAVGIVLNPAAFGTAAQWANAVNPPFQSMYNLQGLIMWTIAGIANKSEQLWDAFTGDVEAIVSVSSPQTPQWFQDQMLNTFQANAADPQVVEINPPNFVPSYPVVNNNYKVIKYCAAVSGTSGNALIKVAAQVSGLPVDLDTATFSGCLASAQSFVDTIGITGVAYVVSSGASDKLYMQLDVYYTGQYAATIQTNVINAIIAYMANIPFNGTLTLSKLEEAILAVPGVADVVFNNVQARPDIVPAGTGTNLVLANTTIQKDWQTKAGYIIPENTSGWTLTDLRAGSSTINNLHLIPS